MLQNRVREYSTSTGTGTFNLDGAIDATYQDFVSAFGSGNPCFYTIMNMDSLEWEIGRGVCNSGSPNTLTRSVVLESSNSGSPVSFSSGLKQVFCGIPQQFFSVTALADYVPRADANGKISNDWLKNSIGYDYFKTVTYSSSINIDMNNGSKQLITLTGNPTLSLTNTSANGDVFTIALKQDGTGGRTVTWFSGITWHNGAQQPSSAANSITYFHFVRLADGTIHSYNYIANLLITSGKTFTVSNTLTLAGTDGSTLNVGAGGTLADLAFKSSVDCSTSDVTGTLAAARMPALTGDVTSSAGSVATTLTAIVSAAGPIGNSTTVPVITIDAKGRVTGLTTATISVENGTFTDVTTNNRSTTKHGFAAKFNGVSTNFEDMTGVQRALTASDLGTTMQPQFAYIGVGTAVDTTYRLTMSGGASNCLGSFVTTGTTTQAGFNLGYSGQTFRVAANGSFGGFVITDVTNSAARFFLDTTGKIAVGHADPAILGKFEVRSTGTNQFVVSYNATNYATFTVSSAGVFTIAGAGTSKGISLPDGLVVGSGSARAKFGGVLKTISSTTSNVGPSESDLHSYTLPADSLSVDGDTIRFTMSFETANNANNKTIKVKFGSTTIFDTTALPASNSVVQISGTITRTGATTQRGIVTLIASDGSAYPSPHIIRSSPSETLSGSVVLKATATAVSSDVTQYLTEVEYLPSN